MDPVRSDPIPSLISPLPELIRSYPAPIPDLTQSLLNGSDPAPDLIHCLPACTRSFSAPPRPGSAPSPSAPTPKGNGSATATGRASQNDFRSIAEGCGIGLGRACWLHPEQARQGKTRKNKDPCFSLFLLVSSLFFLVFPCFSLFLPCFSLFLTPP
jgi:hypothetical protein